MFVLCDAVPPLPVQESVYVPVVVRLVRVCKLEVALVPLHAPLAVQEVALVELHVSVDELPDDTDAGDAERVMVGVGVDALPVVALTPVDCTDVYPAASVAEMV